MKRIDPDKEWLLGGFDNPDNRYIICYIEEGQIFTSQIRVENQRVYWYQDGHDDSNDWEYWASLNSFQTPSLQLWHEAQWFKISTAEEFKKEFNIE